MKSIAEIAEMYNVSRTAVYNWLKAGLPYKVEKIVGKKPRKIIDPADVDKHLQVGIKDNK